MLRVQPEKARIWGGSIDNWADAQTYCQNLNLGGYSSGWRLPTLIELESVVNDSVYNPAIDTTAFPGTPSYWFWSSSPYAYATSGAWVVNFVFGYTLTYDTSNTYRVRCVR
jgi:hypothetical protein